MTITPETQTDLVSVQRGGLFTVCPVTRGYTRDDMVAMARSGIDGFLVSETVTLTVDRAAESARFIGFLRDAAGVGLRVVWSGATIGIPVQDLVHLDPARRRDGSTIWPRPRGAMLTMRKGPGFVHVEDRRGGVLRRIAIDDPSQVRLLSDPGLAMVTAGELPGGRVETARELARAGLLTSIGPYWVRLPVRFRYARS